MADKSPGYSLSPSGPGRSGGENFCPIFGFCTTYGYGQTSIIYVRPPAAGTATRITVTAGKRENVQPGVVIPAQAGTRVSRSGGCRDRAEGGGVVGAKGLSPTCPFLRLLSSFAAMPSPQPYGLLLFLFLVSQYPWNIKRRRGPFVRNEANSGRLDGTRPAERGTNVRNEPNSSIADFGLRIADWGQTCGGTPALRPAHANRAKRTQFRGAIPRSGGRIAQNKANLRQDGTSGGRHAKGGAKRAKRTQLPEAGHRGGVSIADCGLRTGDRPAVGRDVQNEPNFRRDGVGRDLGDGRRTCKTKPISRSPAGAGGRSVQNEAKRRSVVASGR